jgi:hypothetical protein
MASLLPDDYINPVTESSHSFLSSFQCCTGDGEHFFGAEPEQTTRASMSLTTALLFLDPYGNPVAESYRAVVHGESEILRLSSTDEAISTEGEPEEILPLPSSCFQLQVFGVIEMLVEQLLGYGDAIVVVVFVVVVVVASAAVDVLILPFLALANFLYCDKFIWQHQKTRNLQKTSQQLAEAKAEVFTVSCFFAKTKVFQQSSSSFLSRIYTF